MNRDIGLRQMGPPLARFLIAGLLLACGAQLSAREGSAQAGASPASVTIAAPAEAAPQDPAASLLSRLAARDFRAGRFEQRIEDANRVLLEESAGSYAMKRPDRLRWELNRPDEQLVVVDGAVLWHYDRDLASATRRRLDGDREQLPLQALNGDGTLLRERYRVERLDGGEAGVERYRLVPRMGGAGFENLTASFRGDALVGLLIVDELAQRIVIDLSPDPDAREPGPALFRFTPPPGTDVFDDAR